MLDKSSGGSIDPALPQATLCVSKGEAREREREDANIYKCVSRDDEEIEKTMKEEIEEV
jgi:hypothetical protein